MAGRMRRWRGPGASDARCHANGRGLIKKVGDWSVVMIIVDLEENW